MNQSSNSNGGRIKCQAAQLCSTKGYFSAYHGILRELPYPELERVMERLMRAYEARETVFVFGNGGSAALASHFACDLGKGTVIDFNWSKRFRVLALTDNLPLITAWANDACYDDVFTEQLRNLISPGDVAFAISGSGNSPNVLRALELAKESGNTTIGLTGYAGGKMKALCDYCVIVPSSNMQIIEDFHLSVCHAIFTSVREQIRAASTMVAAAASSAAHAD